MAATTRRRSCSLPRGRASCDSGDSRTASCAARPCDWRPEWTAAAGRRARMARTMFVLLLLLLLLPLFCPRLGRTRRALKHLRGVVVGEYEEQSSSAVQRQPQSICARCSHSCCARVVWHAMDWRPSEAETTGDDDDDAVSSRARRLRHLHCHCHCHPPPRTSCRESRAS